MRCVKPRSPTLEDVLVQAKNLSPLDKVRLIERIAPDVERELIQQGARKRSVRGLCRELGPAPSFEEMDEARREAWSGLGRPESR